ncbi:MAG: hypothetical protein WCT77_01915 [Bacteroidota bacterium]|jgi:hypothetical protein
MNTINLKYEEQVYDVEYNRNLYKVSIIQDLETGETENVVIKYNKKGELVVPTAKQRVAVLTFVGENI